MSPPEETVAADYDWREHDHGEGLEGHPTWDGGRMSPAS